MVERMRISYILNEVDLPYASYNQIPHGEFVNIGTRKEADAQFTEDDPGIPPHDWDTLCATRVIEVVNDFRSIQHNIIIHSASSSFDSVTNEECYILCRCQEAANQLLQLPMFMHSDGCHEDSDAQLKSCMLDACARRHVAFRVYKIVAAVRHQITGRRMGLATIPVDDSYVQHLPILGTYEHTQNNSDAAIYEELRTVDHNAGYWTNYDPRLEDILSYAGLNFTHIVSNLLDLDLQ